MSLARGTHLGPYEIVAAIGAGGMGEVYRAKDTRLDRQVAVKVRPERVAGDPEALAPRTRDETQAPGGDYDLHPEGVERGTRIAA